MGTVTSLPTAAKRRIRQETGKAAKLARESYQAENRWPGEFLYEWQRHERKVQEHLDKLTRSPELLLVMAILSGADQGVKQRVHTITKFVAKHHPHCRATQQAMAIADRLCRYGDMGVVVDDLNDKAFGPEER